MSDESLLRRNIPSGPQPRLNNSGNQMRVAGLLYLAGTKAAVVQRRAEAKDYIDIAAMIQTGPIDLPTALASARAIYGEQFSPQITLKALSYFDDGDLGNLSKETKDCLASAAREVDLDRLPDIGQVEKGSGKERGSEG